MFSSFLKGQKNKTKTKSTQERVFQSDFIYQYIEIFKSNPLQKMKKSGTSLVLTQFIFACTTAGLSLSWFVWVFFFKPKTNKNNTRRK